MSESIQGVKIRVGGARERERFAPPLVEGEEVRLTEGGPWYVVERVTPGAANLRKVHEPELVVIPPSEKVVRTPTGTKIVPVPGREFWSRGRGALEAYSRHAHVVERRKP